MFTNCIYNKNVTEIFFNNFCVYSAFRGIYNLHMIRGLILHTRGDAFMKVAIIGGGFAGRAAAKTLGNALGGRSDYEIVLIDRNDYTTMLPSLPDLAGQRVKAEDLKESIEKLLPPHVKFLKKNITLVDFNEKTIQFEGGDHYTYDYMVFAPGSKTNFYGNTALPQTAYKMDCLDDAIKIQAAARQFIHDHDTVNIVVSGAGFTGIELAVNMYHLAHEMGKKPRVVLAEVTNKVLPMLTDKMSSHVKKTIEGLGIEFLLEHEVVGYENETVSFKNGTQIDNAFYAWCAGVMTSVCTTGNQQELRDRRILVDSYLRIPEHPEVFVAGDAAAFKDEKGNCIRRAVNFASTQGSTAGKNILKAMAKQTLEPYKIVDLGWIIPLYVDSIGEAFGNPVKGRMGITFHYLICGIKNYNFTNLAHYIGYSVKFLFTKAKA